MLKLIETSSIKHAIIDSEGKRLCGFFEATSSALGSENLCDARDYLECSQFFDDFLQATTWLPQSMVLITHRPIAAQTARMQYPQMSVIGVADELNQVQILQAQGARIIISSAADVGLSIRILSEGYSDELAMQFRGEVWCYLPRDRPEIEVNADRLISHPFV